MKMKKRIIIGSIMAIFLIMMMPCISALKVQTSETIKTNTDNVNRNEKNIGKILEKAELNILFKDKLSDKNIKNLIDVEEFGGGNMLDLDGPSDLCIFIAEIVFIILLPLEIFGLITAPITVPLAGLLMLIPTVIFGGILPFPSVFIDLVRQIYSLINVEFFDYDNLKIIFGPILASMFKSIGDGIKLLVSAVGAVIVLVPALLYNMLESWMLLMSAWMDIWTDWLGEQYYTKNPVGSAS